jgi:S-disulfanyl-L-cysteine oxidoreductase SoxD
MRRRILSIAVSAFALILLASGLAASFLEEGAGYKISPEMKPAEPRAPTLTTATAGEPESKHKTMPPAITPARFKLRPDDAALVAEGKQNYTTHCASCHGANLEGQPNWKERGADGKMPAPPHDASGHTWHHPGGMLFAITKFGPARISGQPSEMSGYANVLTDEQIVGVLSFIKSKWSSDIRERHDQITAKGKGG